ncbi:MAG: Helix-turn-helix domain protein [Verrucomicrobiales bacterium]|nr:Helix-turn-helix domain protein [Verrucomicrobiales bacterium]
MQTQNSQTQRCEMSEPFEPFIGKAEIGKRLGVRPRTVDEWMRLGILPHYKFSQAVRFKWSEVEAHLAETCRRCPPLLSGARRKNFSELVNTKTNTNRKTK